MLSSKLYIPFIFLFIIACIGTILRGFHFLGISLDYENLMHAHSHIAFQGWIYLALFISSTSLYLSKEQFKKGNYKLQFILTIGILIGVLISFSLFGYGLYSIIVSTLFQLLNYWLFYRLIQDTKGIEKTVSLKFLKTGIYLGILSNIAPYVVGILSAKGFGNSEYYQAAIYFFLHFQYNGWFLFIALGVLFKIIENQKLNFNEDYAIIFFKLLSIAVIPAVALSYLGLSFRSWFIIPAIISATIQIIAMYYLKISLKNTCVNWIIKLSIYAFIAKSFLQLLSTLPSFENISFNNRPIIIAFMHLSLIGVLSFLIIGTLFQLKWIKNTKLFKLGFILFLIGFIITELVLVCNGFGYINSSYTLFIFSLCMVIGIFFILISNYFFSKISLILGLK